jgi:hypothetical protein
MTVGKEQKAEGVWIEVKGSDIDTGLAHSTPFLTNIGVASCSVHGSEQSFGRLALVRSVNPGLTLRCQTKGGTSSEFYARVYAKLWTVKNGPLFLLG